MYGKYPEAIIVTLFDRPKHCWDDDVSSVLGVCVCSCKWKIYNASKDNGTYVTNVLSGTILHCPVGMYLYY